MDSINLNVKEAMLEQRVKFARIGLFIAAMTGVGLGLQSSMTGVAAELYPFADPSYGIWMLIICSFICSGLHDFTAGIWILIFNKVSKRSISEYIRLLKTKVGWLLIVGALLGGPVATASNMAATYLCNPTYSLAITGIFPIIGTLTGVIFLKEKVSLRTWMGIIIAIVGVFIVSYSPPSDEVYPYFGIGIIFALLAAIGWGTEGYFASYAADMVDPNIAVGTFRSFGSGLFILLIMVPITCVIGGVGGGTGFHILGTAFHEGAPILAMVVAALGGGTSMYSFYQSVNHVGVGRTTAFNVTGTLWSIPFCLILQAMGLMVYEVTPQAIIGAIITIIGVMLTIANPKQMITQRNTDF